MDEKLIGRVVFLRHGETDYTDVFPDLTEEGKRTIEESAKTIRAIKNYHPWLLSVVSSPAVRALGSASIITGILGFKEKIIKEPLIGPVVMRDTKRALAIYDEHISSKGMKGLCISYAQDERFDNPEVFEPRSQVRKRFYKYLAGLVHYMLSCISMKPFIICVSHYETLYHFVENPFQLDYTNDSPFGFGEIILASFYVTDFKNEVKICLRFRESENNIIFNYKTKSIVIGL